MLLHKITKNVTSTTYVEVYNLRTLNGDQKIQLATAMRKLDALPGKAPTKISVRDALKEHRTEIQRARNRGYSWEDISEMLAEEGIGISVATIKAAVSTPPSKRRTKTDTPA